MDIDFSGKVIGSKLMILMLEYIQVWSIHVIQ